MGIVSRGRPITNRNLTPNPIRSELKRVVVSGSVGPSTVLLPLKHWSSVKVLKKKKKNTAFRRPFTSLAKDLTVKCKNERACLGT